MFCPGSHVLQAGAPDNTSAYAAEGTAAHQLLTWCLQDGKTAADYVGIQIDLDEHGRVITLGGVPVAYSFTVDADMAEHVQVTLDYVREAAGDDGIVLVDQRVNYSSYLGVPEDQAWGTLDVAIIRGNEINCIDLKYGRGVEVEASKNGWPNPQLALYALGILQSVKEFAEIDRVRLTISQPRVSKKPSEFDLSVADLERWAEMRAAPTVRACQNAERQVADPQWNKTFLEPGEKQCRFCKAKATCPALRDEVAHSVGMNVSPASPDEFAELRVDEPKDFTTAQWVAAGLSKVDLIEDWCKAIRAEAERRLLAGEPVPGFKLVQGKRGARAWSNPAEAEKLLREVFRLPIEKAYDLKLISPTTAEKLHKAGEIGPRQWPKAQQLITQSDGKPHVAPESDARPALVITPVSDDFAPVASAEDFA